MSASDYRAKAAQYEGLSGRTADFTTARRYLARAHSYTQLADNEEWLAEHPGALFSKPATLKTTADETVASEGGRPTAGAIDVYVNSNTEEVTPMTTSNQPNQSGQQQNQGGQQGGQQQGGQDQTPGQQTQTPGQGGQQGDQKPAQPSQPQK